MDSVASNTSNEEATHVSPQYDSSEEWEIGLGNLIIDLDADLEKDRQDGSGAAGSGGNTNSTSAGAGSTPADSSPLRIGKMKIKRKVSTNTPTTPSKGSDGASPRGNKDALLSTDENSSGSSGGAGHMSPVPQTERIMMVVKEEKLEKAAKCSVRNVSGNTSVTGGSSNATPHHKQDSSVATSAAHVVVGASASKHLEKVLSGGTNTKGSIPLNSGDISLHHGKYNSSSVSAPNSMATTTTNSDKKDLSVDNICRIKPSVLDLKQQIGINKKDNTSSGSKKKEEKEGKGETSTGKKGGDGSTKRQKKRGDKTSSVGVGTSDAGTLTEPENLGPCEPGTSVNLEGIVWHETDQGVLVVNVTWRNKTYVGTLMDCTRHDWAPPRFCDSPTSDVENRTNKTIGRPKRGRASNNTTNTNDMSNFTETRSSAHSKLRNSSALKGRKGNSANGARTPPGTNDKPEKPEKGKRKHRNAETGGSSGEDSTKSAKRLKISTKQNAPAVPTEVIPEMNANGLIECPEPNCSKKYKHINGLRYHRQHAHQEDKAEDEDEEEDEEQDSETKSSSDEGSVASAADIDNHVVVKSKSDWNDSSRTNGASTTIETKATAAAIPQPVDQAVDKRQLYSTAAAAAAATAAAAAAASAAELLQSKEDAAPAKASKGHKTSSSLSSSADKTSPKLFSKSKDTVAIPVKSKGDVPEKSGGKPKKGHSLSSSDKDLSVFDFNSAIDSDGLAGSAASADKHVSVIRPTADVSSVASPLKTSDLVAPVAMAPAKLQDVIHTMPLPGSEHMEDLQQQKPSKKSDKEKTKSGERKKVKHDKVPNSKVKPTRPHTASPIPPQLVAVPANVAAGKGSATATTQPPKMPPAGSTKQTVNPALKPIQPKASVPGEAAPSPPVANPKEKKSKSKKKSKDKDKEREKAASNCTKDKESKDTSSSSVTKQQFVQQPSAAIPLVKQSVAPTLPLTVAKPQTQVPPPVAAGNINTALTETNILHQALTASGIGPEDAERNSPSVTSNSGEVLPTKVVDQSQVASKEQQQQQQQTKDTRPVFPNRPPVQHGSMPEMPKLIPTSSVVNPGGRPPVNAVAQPQLPTHQVNPIQPVVVPDNSKVDQSAIPLPPQMKATLLTDTESNAAPEESRARSPAYSDISDANEDSDVPPKTLNDRDPFSFQDASRNQTKVGSRDEHIHSKSLFTPLLDVGREHLPDGIQKAQQDSLRTVPPLVQPVKPDAGKEGSQTEGPDAKKPRKDTGSPRLPGVGEPGYRPPGASQAYPGQYPYMSGFVMDQQYHMHLFNTDHHYRQQHEQFRQEQKQLQEKERLERERHERNTKDKAPSNKTQEENRDRTIPRIKTEPITPPKRNVLGEKGQERSGTERPPTGDNLLKRKQLDFHKPGSESTASSETSSERSATQPEEPARHGAKSYIHQQHQEEMRQYYIYQQKVQEQQKYEEEQRRKLEESRSSTEPGVSGKEKDATREESADRHRTTRSPSPQRPNPPKSRSPALSSVEERKLRQSPATSSPSPHSRDPKAAMSSSSSRKVLEYPSYLQHTPYGPMPMHQTPYGPIPIDPNHPAYHHNVNPLVAYPAYLGHDMRYAGPVVSPVWKSPDEKGHFEHERSSRAISPHQASTSRGASPSEPPPKALDLLQQHASRYYQKHDRARSPGDKSRTSSPQRRPSSPRKSPESSSASRERLEAHRAEQMQAMIHQHMHTHQHTHHVGMGYPAVLPPYPDPYVLASQQAAAAAAAGVAPPYAVRREPP